VNSRWNLKQVRNGSNRCIDLAETRLDLRAVDFGESFVNGIIIVIGNGLVGLRESFLFGRLDVSASEYRTSTYRDRTQRNLE
jgi:hypothetical protein